MEIRIDALARSFGPVEAVRGISLEIREGETFGLLGPNGAGKTTTLSMLSTLLAPSSGDAWIFGESLRRNVSEVKRIVGLAPQEISLYPDLTAEENLVFFGRISGVHGRRLRRRVEELLELVGLTPRRGEPVRTFSGGMKRRLNLACSSWCCASSRSRVCCCCWARGWPAWLRLAAGACGASGTSPLLV